MAKLSTQNRRASDKPQAAAAKKTPGKAKASTPAKKTPKAAVEVSEPVAAATPARRGRVSAVAGLKYKKVKDAPAWATLREGTKRRELMDVVAAGTKADDVIGSTTPSGYVVNAGDVKFALDTGFIAGV